MRLAYVINDGPFFVSHFLPHAVAAHAAGFDVHVIVPSSEATATIRSAGLAVHPLPLTRSGRTVWGEVTSFAALYRLFRSLRPDLAHLITIKPVIYGGIAGRLASVPSVVSSVTGLGYVFLARGKRAAAFRLFVRMAYRLAFRSRNIRVLFENTDDRDMFVAAKLVAQENTATIRGAGVDINAFVPSREPDGSPVVVMAARLLRDKGVGEFVAAARLLAAQGTEARFVLVGDYDPANPSAIEPEQLHAWQRDGIVEWWGKRSDMPRVFSQAHVVCLPSYREGLPKVLVEAAACARPIVSTDVPGCREIVRHGDNGLLVPVRDADALAAALKRLIGDPVLRARMGQCGRNMVEAEFSTDKVVAQMLGTYRALLARAAAVSPARS